LGGGGFTAFAVRALNAFYFGLVFYLTVLLRVRRRSGATPSAVQRMGQRMSGWLATLLARAQPVQRAEVPREE